MFSVPRTDSIYQLPENLPLPTDDGACNHLPGLRLPSTALPATNGGKVELANLAGTTVLYCYPRTGRSDQELPPGWNDIPGARGCTPQSCAFRDHHLELQRLSARVFGISTQSTEYQQEAAQRLHLPFALLSDGELQFVSALRLPTFEVGEMTLIKRLTLILRDGRIAKVFYPVFPPDLNALQVINWLSHNPGGC